MTHQREGWLEASDVIPMFPTLVWKLQLAPAVRDSLRASLMPMVEAMRRGLPPLAPGAGWQSATTLHQRDETRELVACVMKAAKSVLRFWRVGYEALEITGCWANVLAPGGVHRPHTHPNNYLSGVYYMQTSPGADTINFHDPRVQSAIIRAPVVELTAENTDQVVVAVVDGTLLLFPAYLQHSVDANASAHERISVSFNLMFSSFAETLAKPMW